MVDRVFCLVWGCFFEIGGGLSGLGGWWFVMVGGKLLQVEVAA